MAISADVKGQNRVIVERVVPELDGGRFYIKAVPGEIVEVEADIFCDGHDKTAARLLYKHQSDKKWQEAPLALINNDRWGGQFVVEKEGFYHYTLEAWIDHLASWQHEAILKIRDGQHVHVELLAGAQLLEKMAKRAAKEDKPAIQEAAKAFRSENRYDEAVLLAIDESFRTWSRKYPEIENATRYQELRVWVDRAKAGFSTWYSMFPRSAAREIGKHGTFNDVVALLPRIANMGFDVLYLPPIHPIGHKFRKGKNNNTVCQPDEPGVPYGIGSELGGHDAIHPDLGTLADFKALIAASKSQGIEIAMDLAIQCSPDHPWAKNHPEWFKIRPDGTIQYAENPPKKYQDIYPINFETEAWESLWEEMRRIILLWAEWGVRIIRVDNPHTKAFGFWEWVIAETKQKYPDMIFLAEAFTRPKVMQQLAKGGYAQSYTYYSWRNSKQELTEYLTELTQSEMKYYFRPNFWPNTHDINPPLLQTGHEPNYLIRFFMAATLSANYGLFGPTYEYMVSEVFPGKEEYLNSEKYEIKYWDWEHTNKLTHIITEVNRARRQNSALQQTNNLTFCNVDNDQMMAYLKIHANGNRILCVVNLDGYNKRSGVVQMPLHKIDKAGWEEYRVRDLITDAVYTWKGAYNFVELDPYFLPFHLFRIEDL
ncbi:MAG: alpha-1,4-glucan--maltose-1-phosphate maltosyltransferase [Runella slithyformis]|nr:MAG: alpha-1,4-glucan--maltose-1-phosphate maltosyltransferase [Runella slithyformis]TAE95270.1 MAG: alpha-1,4-glucan--maltose-1-phosphate maltosyltransferase [Runella slithyformis]TAF28939.1 MAG: alpha-1,4-glucan--maltose-1-phosphate maltosyltransferase [Runella slithyformis]TAF47991.1 MAG: alpha-1,4-glucan--maltose-1-phosphate maltosyltransferase [Runella slithyformis]TAF82477.1 MAG: alpha-1,4-glucan--maltose-1-phosphate maltosyltransferase [Runella slithyformis]